MATTVSAGDVAAMVQLSRDIYETAFRSQSTHFDTDKVLEPGSKKSADKSYKKDSVSIETNTGQFLDFGSEVNQQTEEQQKQEQDARQLIPNIDPSCKVLDQSTSREEDFEWSLEQVEVKLSPFKISRRRALSPRKRARIAEVRKVGACAPCKMRKIRVCKIHHKHPVVGNLTLNQCGHSVHRENEEDGDEDGDLINFFQYRTPRMELQDVTSRLRDYGRERNYLAERIKHELDWAEFFARRDLLSQDIPSARPMQRKSTYRRNPIHEEAFVNKEIASLAQDLLKIKHTHGSLQSAADELGEKVTFEENLAKPRLSREILADTREEGPPEQRSEANGQPHMVQLQKMLHSHISQQPQSSLGWQVETSPLERLNHVWQLYISLPPRLSMNSLYIKQKLT